MLVAVVIEQLDRRRALGHQRRDLDLVLVFGLGQVHPGLRRVLLQLGVVGDRPTERLARPDLRRHLDVFAIVGGIRRRVIRQQILQRENEALRRELAQLCKQVTDLAKLVNSPISLKIKACIDGCTPGGPYVAIFGKLKVNGQIEDVY